MARFPYFGFPFQYPYYRYYNQNKYINNNNKTSHSIENDYNQTSSIINDINENKNTEENISSVQSNRSYLNNIFPFSFDFNGFSNSDDPIIDIFGIKLYLDDIIILCLLFILYKEDVKDEMLFIALILLLLN